MGEIGPVHLATLNRALRSRLPRLGYRALLLDWPPSKGLLEAEQEPCERNTNISGSRVRA